MFKSKEVRWFSNSVLPQIEAWFGRHDLSVDSVEARTDHYLSAYPRIDMGVKLREGKVEVKHRLGRPSTEELVDGALGKFENWVKWSFLLRVDDMESNAVIIDGQPDWIPVRKWRIGVKLAADENGDLKIHGIDDQVQSACQVEYTKVQVDDRFWMTFGLEWFGDPLNEVPIKTLEDIIGNTYLPLENSMGYAEFVQLHANGSRGR